MATIIAISTDAIILFHSKDDIGALFRTLDKRDGGTTATGYGGDLPQPAAENRILAANSNKLSRFRRAIEPGMLSLVAINSRG